MATCIAWDYERWRRLRRCRRRPRRSPLLLLAPARTWRTAPRPPRASTTSGHGQSQWNAEQTLCANLASPTPAIKRSATRSASSTAASARGVNEALTLQRNLTLTPDAPWYTLGGVARARSRAHASRCCSRPTCGARSTRRCSGCGRSSSRRSTTGCTACSCCPRCRRRAATPTACRRHAAPTARSPRRRPRNDDDDDDGADEPLRTVLAAQAHAREQAALEMAAAVAPALDGSNDGVDGVLLAAEARATAAAAAMKAQADTASFLDGAYATMPAWRRTRSGTTGATCPTGVPPSRRRRTAATARRAAQPRAAWRGAGATLGAAAERRRRRGGGAPGARQEERARRRAPRRSRRALALPARAASRLPYRLHRARPQRARRRRRADAARLERAAVERCGVRRSLARGHADGERGRRPGSSRSRLPTRRARCPPSRCTAAASTTAARCCRDGRRRPRPGPTAAAISSAAAAHGGVARVFDCPRVAAARAQ